MTQKEYEQSCEIKKLKAENLKLNNKNKDLESEKKTLSNKLNLQTEQFEDYKKENNIDKLLEYKKKYELINDSYEKLKEQLDDKNDYIIKVAASLNKNSSNSSKPSSTDGFKKIVHNSRIKTGEKVGGKINHIYHEPTLVQNPNEIVKIKKQRNCDCGGKIIYDKEIIKRQLIELITKYYVVEYQGQVGKCSKCGKIYLPKFPKGINNTVQYNDEVKGFSLLLSERANVPTNKIKELIGVLTNTQGPAQSSIMYWKENTYAYMKPIIDDIKNEIIKEPVMNHDETPLKVNGKFHYALGAFTNNLSAIECYPSRGKVSFDEMNIYPRYGGTIVGDHYALNESFQGQTAYCNEHTSRSAKGVLDIRKDSYAKEYIEFIYQLKKEVEETKENKLSNNRYKEVKKEYIELLKKWKKEFNKFVKGKDRKYYKDERNLIELLLEYVDGHLMFAKESLIPFTNNDAERGLRPIKTKMKVIGGFRESDYANGYCNSISIIQTAQKQGLNPCAVLGKIVSGERKVFEFQNAIS